MHFIYTLAFVVPICYRVEGTKALERIDLAFVLYMQSKGFYEQSIVTFKYFLVLVQVRYNRCVVVVGGIVINLIFRVEWAESSMQFKLVRSVERSVGVKFKNDLVV